MASRGSVRSSARVHETAVVHPEALLGREVDIGPYAIVGAGVELGSRTRVHGHAVLEGPMRMGENNVVHPFAVLGAAAQYRAKIDPARMNDTVHSLASSESHGTLEIGNGNVFREHVTVHRGTEGRATRIGDENLFMASSHVAHDVVLGSHVTLANGVQLAGHCIVGDHATFGGLSGVAQYVEIGESAFVAAGAMCERRVPPFVVVQGDRARVRALNVVGLRRRGLPNDTMSRLERAFRVLFARNQPLSSVLAAMPSELSDDPFVEKLVAALR